MPRPWYDAVTEQEEPALCLCGKGYVGHAEHRVFEAAGTFWLLPDYALAPDPGETPTQCSACAAVILFVRTRKGKRAPLNPDGTSHFASCPAADRFRRRT